MSRILLAIKSLLTPERELVSLLAAELQFVTNIYVCSCKCLNCNTKQATINSNYFQFTVHDLLHTVSVQLAHHYVTGQMIYP